MRRLLLVMFLGMSASGCPESKTPDDGRAGTGAVTEPAGPSTAASDTATSAAAPATPSATPTAMPTAALVGGWTIELTTVERGGKTAPPGTPADRAKRLFDHVATVEGGKVRVDQRTLGKHWLMEAGAEAALLEQAARTLDWQKMKLRTSLEEGQVGGTIYRFKVTVGADQHELATGNLEAYPELHKIVAVLKKTAGVP